MSVRVYGFLATTLTFVGLLAITLIMSSQERPLAIIYTEPQDGLPVLGQVTDFAFTDSENKPFGFSDMQGQVWVADFIFTTCAGICPVMSSNMADLHREFADVDNVKFVSFSVDPETDTPEVMQAYSEIYEADTSSWHFLTSSEDEVHTLAVEGFKIGSVDDAFIHSSRFVLVDGAGQIRGYYEGLEDEGLDELRRDLPLLLSE